MTIKEYKQAFIKLLEQFEEEHGVSATVELHHHYKSNSDDTYIECYLRTC